MNETATMSAPNRDILRNVEDVMSEDEARKRREQLNRRPSYRMILKDLETVTDKNIIKKEPNESDIVVVTNNNSTLLPQNIATPVPVLPLKMDCSNNYISPVIPAQQQQQQQQHPSSSSELRMPTLLSDPNTVTGSSLNIIPPSSIPTSVVSNPTGIMIPINTDILHLKNINESLSLGQFPGVSNNNGDWQPGLLNYNSPPNHLNSGPASASSKSSLGMGDGDDTTKKRQVRLMKNREAAKECRRKKKEYVKCLENRVSVLENQNKALIEELKTLKELYCQKGKPEM
uniref:BZIP domain-containing protein n=1 Tax=Parastrongyloides trichosuri TaxID=131310 RepID=A0A0N4ZH71_PARTI